MQIEKRMKVPNGKLLVIKVAAENGSILRAAIQGDFFFYPEEKLSLFEDAIRTTSPETLAGELHRIAKNNDVQLCGITIEAVTLLVQEIRAEMGQ